MIQFATPSWFCRPTRSRPPPHASAALFALLALSCGGDAAEDSGVRCEPGVMKVCSCADMRPGGMMCMPDGKHFAACMCGTSTMTVPVISSGGRGGAAAPALGTAGPSTGFAGMAASAAGRSGGVNQGGRMGPVPVATAGAPGRSGGPSSAGAPAAAGSTANPPTAGSSPGAAGATASSSDLETARQVCVDEINRYRAMVMVPALMRGTPAQEMCSDTGAKKDGDSGTAHGSSGDCRSMGLPGQQDTCPGWPVGGGRGGYPTVADALKACLMQMWAEGDPPEGRQACIADRSGCFQKHGHYLNMSDPSPKVVACGFYQMTNGKWWMNQNFGR